MIKTQRERMAFFFLFLHAAGSRPRPSCTHDHLLCVRSKETRGGTGRGRGHCISIYRVASRAIMTREVEAAAAAEVAGNDVE